MNDIFFSCEVNFSFSVYCLYNVSMYNIHRYLTSLDHFKGVFSTIILLVFFFGLCVNFMALVVDAFNVIFHYEKQRIAKSICDSGGEVYT